MCKLIVGVKLNNKKNEEFGNLIDAQRETLSGERHGICSLSVDTKNKIKVKREFDTDRYDMVVNDTLKDIKDKKVVSLHTRTGTSGEFGLLNVHFFENERYLMAHNGFVGKYHGSEYSNSRKLGFENNWGWSQTYGYHRETPIDSEVKKELEESANPKNWCIDCASLYETDEYCEAHKNYDIPPLLPEPKVIKEDSKYCDSARFVLSLKGDITKESLELEMDSTSFSGIATIYDKKLHKLWILATRDIKIHTDSKNYILMYSFDPENTLVKYSKFLGLPILDSETEIEIEEKVVPAGVYCIDTDNLEVK